MTYEWIPLLAAAIVLVLPSVGALVVLIRQGTRQVAASEKHATAIEVVRRDVNANHTADKREIARHAMGRAVATKNDGDMKVALNAQMNAEDQEELDPPPPKKVKGKV